MALTAREGEIYIIPGLSDFSFTDLFSALATGNAFVYDDVYWQHLAYLIVGMSEIDALHKSGGLNESLYSAWKDIDKGSKNYNQDLVWQGNKKLLRLRYEQEITLQQGIYDKNQKMWKRISTDDKILTWAKPPLFKSPIPGDKNGFSSYVKKGNFGSFPDRWKWIEESMLPSYRKLTETQPENVKKLMKNLYAHKVNLK